MSDPTPSAPIDVTPTPPRAPSTAGQGEVTYYFAGRASTTTTSESGGGTATTSDVSVLGGRRYTSTDRNGNGTADTTVDVGAFYTQSSVDARYGVGVEARREVSRSSSVFGRVQATDQDVQAVVGFEARFGGPSRPRQSDPVEAAERVLDRELRDVYRDPSAVRDRLDALDRGTDPRGLTFGEIAGRLYAPEAAGLVSGADGLTPNGADEAQRFDTLVAYAGFREAQLTPLTKGSQASDYAALVEGKGTIIAGFEATYGDGWQEAYGRFNEALRAGGLDRAIETLPPETASGKPATLAAALRVQDTIDSAFPDGMVTGAREQAEINQFRRDEGIPSAEPDRGPRVQAPSPAGLER